MLLYKNQAFIPESVTVALFYHPRYVFGKRPERYSIFKSQETELLLKQSCTKLYLPMCTRVGTGTSRDFHCLSSQYWLRGLLKLEEPVKTHPE